MPNETKAVMTGTGQRAVAAHQPGQDIFKSVLSEDINWKPFAALAFEIVAGMNRQGTAFEFGVGRHTRKWHIRGHASGGRRFPDQHHRIGMCRPRRAKSFAIRCIFAVEVGVF
ncbi:MAG: hypothetical protein WAM89_14415 [Terriglobales bacterium]